MRTWTGSCQPTTTHEEPHPPHGHMLTGIRRCLSSPRTAVR